MINIDYLEKASKSSDFFNNLNSLLNNSLKKEFEGTEFEIKLSLTTVNSDLGWIFLLRVRLFAGQCSGIGPLCRGGQQ